MSSTDSPGQTRDGNAMNPRRGSSHSRVVGVMSTFQPDASVVARAQSHIQQLDLLIVVDDGSSHSRSLDELTDPHFLVIKLPANSGIAAALNVGTLAALDADADFILYLDQDSTLEPHYVSSVEEMFALAGPDTRLGIALAERVNEASFRPRRHSAEGFGLVDEGIQSGMVISAECQQSIGLLDERLFIDCVDTEWCLRANSAGWAVGIAPSTRINHSIGRLEPRRAFGRPRTQDGVLLTYQYHPPFRRYYIIRNTIDLCFRNLRIRPRWVLSTIRRELLPTVNPLVSGPYRMKHWLALGVGTWHGLRRRRGKIPHWLATATAEH